MKHRLAAKFLLLALVPAMILSCSPDGTGPSENPGSSLMTNPATLVVATLNPLGTVASCTAQPYAKVSKLIGPAGGDLKVGKHEFKIPPGALPAPVQITMEAVSDTVRSVRFSPEGLAFNPLYLPHLILDNTDCRVPNDRVAKIAWTTEQLLVLQNLGTRNDSINGTSKAKLQHFSRYAIAY
jgi:hypothetical protein